MNGHAHNMATGALTAGMLIGHALNPVSSAALCMAAGAALTLIVNPDTDMETITGNERRLIHRLPVLGRLWVAAWWPYAKMFKHRGVSHWPLIGTATRAGYLFVLICLGMMLVGASAYWDEVTGPALWMFVGAWLSDTIHWVMDL